MIDIEQLVARAGGLVRQLQEAQHQHRELMQANRNALQMHTLRFAKKLTPRLRAELRANYPDFLPPALDTFYQQHMLRMGFIKPKGYDAALIYIQTRLRAFLSIRQHLAADSAIEQVRNRIRELQRELRSIQGVVERNRVTPRPTPAAFTAPADTYYNDLLLLDAYFGNDWRPTAEAQTVTEAVRACMPTEDNPGVLVCAPEAGVVATDDSLGYFS